MIELTMCKRNSNNEKTGDTLNLSSSDGNTIYEFWMNNKGKPERKKDKAFKQKHRAASAKEAALYLQNQKSKELRDYVKNRNSSN